VAERLVVGVEYDIYHADDADDAAETKKPEASAADGQASLAVRREGEFGGWVWDLPPEYGKGGRDEEVWLAYGDYSIPDLERKEQEKKEKGKKQQQETKDWEETTQFGSRGRTGEWRRRRWVRMVRRVSLDEGSR